MKKLMFISLLILLIISISAVSANDDVNQNITEIDNDMGIDNGEILSASSARTFTDLQGQIMRTSAGSTLTLYDDYEYTEGTDRTIGIAIYATTNDITIDGNGHTLDGKNTARILYVNEGATNITIKNLNFVNGYQESGAGAIFWKGESGTIDNCNFTSDSADKSGGAIILAAAKGTITNCNFEKCVSKSQSGGAIYATDASDQTTISNNRFTDNTAKTSGAAIATSGANAAISNNVFTANSASDSGAAIYLSGANTKISDCQFIRNKVDGSGGAIFWKGELGTLDKCNFTSNTAQNNGGAVFWATAKGTITNNRFENSVSNTQSGGAVYCNDLSAQTTISGNVFIDNSAKTCGAGIGSAGANTLIANNIFTDNEVGESGAGVYTSGTNSKINNNTFLRNKAVSGGAVYIEIDGISMDGCYFEANTITGGGGGAMRWNGNSGTMTNCQFTSNTAATRGGAIYWNGNDAKIENNNFTKNTADTAAGGALLYWGNNGQIISNNFDENIATQGYGGALYVDGSSNKVNNNKFNKNTAAKGGGAIYYDGANGRAEGNTITQNSAENACGIRWNGDSATITGNTFKGNKNTNGLNIIFGDGAKATVTQNTFLNNKESDNCIRWNSADATISGNIYKDDTVTTLTGTDVTSYYGESKSLIFTLKSSTQALSGKTVTVSVNNENKDLVTDAQGQVIIDLKDFDAGTYPATAAFKGDSEYDPSTATATATINKAPTQTTLNLTKELYVGDDIIITATVNASEGNVTFYIGLAGESRTRELINGSATLKIPYGFIAGKYPVIAQYSGENNYLASSDEDEFTVFLNPTSILTSDVIMYLSGKGEVVFALVDHNNTPIAGENITITSIYENLTLETNSNGKVKVELQKLELGTYEVNAFYAGHEELYTNSTATATVTVKSTIEAENLEANYGDAQYSAKFFDIDGNSIPKGTYVSFTVVNDYQRVQVDEQGVATVNITNTPGNYVIEVINTVTGENAYYNITINNMPTEVTITGVQDINVGDNLTVTISVNASNGTLTIKINDKNNSIEYTGGDFEMDVTNLPEGDYTFTAIFEPENEYYTGSSANATFSVTKKVNELTVETSDIEEGQDAVFDVTTSIPTGNVTLTIGDKSYTENITNGKATFTVANLTADTYTYTVSTPGNDYYESNSTEGTINVKSTTLIINAPELVKYYHGPERFTLNVTDKDGNPLSNITVTININGKGYDRTTDENGVAGMAINLGPGNYTVVVSFKGNEDYNPVNVTSSITVKTTIEGNDLTKIERSPDPYYAYFRDFNGNLLTEGKAQFNINGVMYYRDIVNGRAQLNINLAANTFTITAINPVTGQMASNTIVVNKRIVNNSDVTKFFRNGTQYYVTVLDDNGNPEKAGTNVTFNINGVMYTRQTNENGTARLNINLNVGEYIITVIYKGCMASNNIKVLPILSAKDITMFYKDGTKFAATLVDGQGKPYVGQNVTFNINGVFYDRTCDENGTARLNINLSPGVFIITSMYDGFAIANTITIKSQ